VLALMLASGLSSCTVSRRVRDWNSRGHGRVTMASLGFCARADGGDAMVPLPGSFVYRIMPRISEWLGIPTPAAGRGLMTLPSGVSATIGLRAGINDGAVSAKYAISVLVAVLVSTGLTFFCSNAFDAHIVTLGHFSKRMGYELVSVAQEGTAAVLIPGALQLG